MTEPYKIIEVKESVFADNDREAARLRTQLKQDRTFLLNLMSSPGSGKTTTLLRTLEALKDELRIGVMEADIDSDVDAKTIADAGVKSIQLHTGGMCHLDASMTEQGLKEIGTKDLDLVVLENVGNLVCPAEFDTGAVKNAMILSVPEGHDKPLKYPLIFTVCDALIINKIDVLPYFDFDMDKAALIGPAPLAARFAADMRTTHNNFGLVVDLSHFPTTYETSRFVIRTLRPYISHFHFGNAVVKPGCDGYGDKHPRFGYPNSANDVAEMLDFLRVLKEEGFFDAENPYVLSAEVTLRLSLIHISEPTRRS